MADGNTEAIRVASNKISTVLIHLRTGDPVWSWHGRIST